MPVPACPTTGCKLQRLSCRPRHGRATSTRRKACLPVRVWRRPQLQGIDLPALRKVNPCFCFLWRYRSSSEYRVKRWLCPGCRCKALFFDAVRTSCDHQFCKQCIAPFCDCPVCGADITDRKPDDALQSELTSLSIKRAEWCHFLFVASSCLFTSRVTDTTSNGSCCTFEQTVQPKHITFITTSFASSSSIIVIKLLKETMTVISI